MRDIKNLKICFIGGGSRGWARNFMNDMAKEQDLSATVYIYDIDSHAAECNAKIGNALCEREDVVGTTKYVVESDMGKALDGADFVIISILPGTFDEMESDVHTPEKYGIYQSVGDSTGPGGIVRALRTLPMFREFALGIKDHCPNAWVINFTNPMSMCVNAMYRVFPEINAFGCCHEVFGTKNLLAQIYNEKYGVMPTRDEISANVSGVNHFTWFTSASCKGEDLFPLYAEFVKNHPDGVKNGEDKNWANSMFACSHQVKFDLFKRFGAIACAGDRHLAEFCPGGWYLSSPERVKEMGFGLTTVAWRKKDLEERIKRQEETAAGKKFELYECGEESVRQIRALLGIEPFVTNVNTPNRGQCPDLPLGAVVATDAFFSSDSVRPLYAGKLPMPVNALVRRIAENQESVVTAALNGDYELAFEAFVNDPNCEITIDNARKLFDEMLFNTKKYLPYYDEYVKRSK